MTVKNLRNALGVLQDEPDNDQAWTDLKSALDADLGGANVKEVTGLLESARRAHEMRREYDAVAELLERETAIAKEHQSPEREAELVAELARIRDDILLDDAGAVAAYERLLALRPGDTGAAEGLERSEVKRAKWKDLAEKYESEAKTANDAAFKSSLFVSAAEMAYRYGRPAIGAEVQEEAPKSKRKSKKKAKDTKEEKATRHGVHDNIVGLLKDALAADPKNRRAALLLERIFQSEDRWEELATALEGFATEVTAKDEKLAALTRLARVYKKKLSDPEKAVAAYERVLDVAPTHAEATGALVDHFTERQMWDHLVSLYEGQLAGARGTQDVGVILQIAMVNWKMRQKPDAAEPYFERVRKQDPTHPGMLAFFREWCAQRGEQTRLVQVLTDAQRATQNVAERGRFAAEIAQLAEEGANAQKAIEQWRNLLRSQPDNVDARDALKRLYRSSGSYNHLADLLRSELERIPPEDAARRLPVLRDIAQIYRENIKSDSALVTVLSQIIALDPVDAGAVRELARVYEALGRWRDLLTTQMRLAELEPIPGVKAELYRAAGRRWLDQFSNVQNAVEAYEKLREHKPDDREAVEKLKELYGKRRAYRQLYDLYEAEVKRLEGAERRAVWAEMARMAADRLDRGADAARLYKAILAEDPNDAAALDALEKQAERDKDYATVAEVLERRVDLANDPQARLAVLQKLGSVYSDRLQDHTGALRVWQRVLDASPGHAKALRIVRDSYLAMADYDGLADLYAATGDFEGLADVLSSTADRVTDVDAKVDLSYRVAAIYETKLSAPERAFRAYERVLSVKPDDRRSAAALVPIYERDDKYARLPALYEVLLGHAADDVEKRALYMKLAEVTGNRLSDKTAAFRYARKAYALAPTEEGAFTYLEGWARASGEWVPFTEAIQERLSSAAASLEERRELRMKLAEVSALHAGRPDDAVTAYRELIESNPEDHAAVAGLDRMLRATLDRKDDLRWLFRLRVNRAEGHAAIPVLAEWALLEEDAFGEPVKAIELLREILGIDPEHLASLRSLGRLLLATGDAKGAAETLVRERDLSAPEERIARELDIARLYVGPLKNPREAIASAKRALEAAPEDPRVITLLEELMPLAECRKDAAVLLEQAYAAAGKFDKQGEVLAVLIATAPSAQDRLSLHLRLAAVKQNLGDRAGAFDVLSRAALDTPAELDLWDRLAVLANKTGKTQQFVETIAHAVPETGDSGLPAHVEIDLAERAATLYDEMLGEIDRATPYLERILAHDPGNDRAFLRLKQILTTRERWADLESLYERMIAATEDRQRRTDLLGEVALIAEEITNDAPKATGYYERILELEPGHEPSIFALDKLYAGQERWQNLASLLRRRIELAGSTGGLALKLRLGTLLFVRLGDPKGALDYLEEVVNGERANRDARELVEKCLTHPDLRQRAAIILEGVYADRDEIRDLVRVLEIRLEFVRDEAERRELLRRVAELKDERLTDDAGSFETYAKLLPLSPGDVEARQRYLEIATRLDRRAEAAEVLALAAKNAEAPQPRAEILGDVAHIYQETNETEKAEAVHRQVLELAPDDPSIALPAIRALERIYAAAGRNRELADVLRAQVKLEEHGPARGALLARLGELAEKALSDDPMAITAWRHRLDDDPGDVEALVALDRLYERAGDHAKLVEILRAREEGESDADAKKALMTRTARTLETLAQVDEALLAYRAILDDFGADRSVLGALSALYEKGERYPDLADTLEADLALAVEPGDRIALLTKLGDIRGKRLSEVEASIEAYRQALTIDPEAASAREALEALLDDEGARGEAAEILRPLYEASGANEKLVRVLDIQIALEGHLEPRLELLARAATVTETDLNDPARATGYASRGLREAAAEPVLEDWIARAERLAERTGSWADLAALYRDVAPEILDEDRQVSVLLRIAELARTKLSDATLAKQSYRRALELRPEEARALEALEGLHEEAGEHEPLLEVLKRRAEIASSDDDKRRILYKQASICDGPLADRERAIAVYEAILDLGLDSPAVTALERLYRDAARWGDLVELHERELGEGRSTGERRAALHHALGTVFERELGEVDRAFDAYAAALDVNPTHEATVESLERIVAQRASGDRAHSARAAEMLEAVYLARLDWRKVMGAVEARLEGSEDPEERRGLLGRLAKLHEEQEENYRAALEVTAKLLAEDVTDETTWAELERLARVANAEDRLAEIYAAELDKITSDEPSTARLSLRTGELYEAQKQDERALGYYRRAYRFAPEEEQKAFQAIDRLLQRIERPAERVALYRDALEYRTEIPERVETLHAIANIEEEDVHDDEAAIVTFRSIIDADETDTRALDALERLFVRREKWRELADLHRRRAEQAALPEDEAKWRLALAQVLDTKLGETLAALDELEAVLSLASDKTAEIKKNAVRTLEAMLGREEFRARVVELLQPIYEQADDWQKLVDVARHRYTVATTPGEKVTVLRETAKLLEERGNDVGRAFDSLQEAFVLDPDDNDTRVELDRLAGMTSRWDDLADAYEKGIDQLDGPSQRELLEALAQLHDERRDDPRRALVAWERLFALDESEPRPLDAIDELSILLSDWSTLVRVLAKRAELTNDTEARGALWRRIGEVRRDMLEDAQGAIDAFERALELEPRNVVSLDRLIALYEERNDAARLVDLYRQRVELAGPDETEVKHRILLDAARCYEVGLSDRREAIGLLRQALETKPDDPAVMKRLSGLYEAEKMWPELLESLRAEAAVATDPDAKRDTTKRMARLLASEEGDHEKALSAYREVLESGYDEEAAAAVRSIGEAREELRHEASAILEPVLAAAGKHDELLAALEMRLGAENDAGPRAATLRAMAKVAENDARDPAKAEDLLLRALAEVPEDDELHVEIERVAALVGTEGQRRYADVLDDRASKIFDATLAASLRMRLGRVAEQQLQDLPRAAEAYGHAARQGGDTPEVLAALERVMGAVGDSRALVDVLERRIAIETTPEAQADLHHRLASLQIDALGEKSQGLATLRLALEKMPGHVQAGEAVFRLLSDDALFDDAFETLEGVYRSTGRGEDLARLYERRVDRAEGTRARTRARLLLARIRECEANDPVGAQRAIEAAVIGDPSDVEAMRELERLADKNDAWREAADALARALEEGEPSSSRTPGQATELWTQLAVWRRDKASDEAGAEAAFGRALAVDADNIDTVRAIEALQRGAGRERDRIASLRRLMKLEGEPSSKLAHAKEAVEIAEKVLSDAKLTEEILREVLDEDETNAWAVEELTRLREVSGDDEEVVKLLLRRAEATRDAAEAQSLRHRAADVAADKLRDRDRAVALYEEILERDPNDERAQTRLRALYEELGKLNELAKLLRSLTEQATSPEARANLRLALAQLSLSKFDQPREAAATLRAILEELPDHEEAASTLLGLYEREGQHAELAELQGALVERARARGDTAAELERMVVLAATLEDKLKDGGRALATYEQILEREPHQRGALEAVARLAEERSQWEKAGSALTKLLETATGEAAVALALRLAHAKAELKDDAGVEAALSRAIEADPKNADVRARLGQLYERTKKWSELASLLAQDADMLEGRELPPVDPTSTTPSALPPSPLVAEQVRLLRRAAEIHLVERREPADAVPVLERATSLLPGDRELLLLLCDAYTAAKRERDAAAVLERIIASYGNKRTKELSLFHHRLAKVQIALGDRDAALAQLDLAFKIDPGSVEVLRDLGVLSLETNDLERAQKTFRALLLQRLDAESGISKGEVFYYLGEISMRQGDKVKAVQMLERAVENEPGLDRAKAMLSDLKGAP